MSDHLQLLKGVPLFQSLDDAALVDLQRQLIPRRIARGARVFSKGDAGSSMFIVVSGSVRVMLPPAEPGAPPVVLQDLGEGEFFGEMALLDSQPRSATIDCPDGAELVELTLAGNVALAAAALELSPSTIYRKRQAWAEMDERRGAA